MASPVATRNREHVPIPFLERLHFAPAARQRTEEERGFDEEVAAPLAAQINIQEPLTF
jgi:hypothetical protein